MDGEGGKAALHAPGCSEEVAHAALVGRDQGVAAATRQQAVYGA